MDQRLMMEAPERRRRPTPPTCATSRSGPAASSCSPARSPRRSSPRRASIDGLRQQYVLAIEAAGGREWRRLDVRVRRPIRDRQGAQRLFRRLARRAAAKTAGASIPHQRAFQTSRIVCGRCMLPSTFRSNLLPGPDLAILGAHRSRNSLVGRQPGACRLSGGSVDVTTECSRVMSSASASRSYRRMRWRRDLPSRSRARAAASCKGAAGTDGGVGDNGLEHCAKPMGAMAVVEPQSEILDGAHALQPAVAGRPDPHDDPAVELLHRRRARRRDAEHDAGASARRGRRGAPGLEHGRRPDGRGRLHHDAVGGLLREQRRRRRRRGRRAVRRRAAASARSPAA